MLDLARSCRGAFARLLLAVLGLGVLAPAAHAAAPDFSLWQALLNRYCIRIADKGQPFDTRFDYEQLYVDDDLWNTPHSRQLAGVRAQLLALPPSAMSAKDRQAWAINTFNFLVIERATINLRVPNRKFLRIKSIQNIVADGSFQFMQAPVVPVEGRTLSLEEFARLYVFADSGSSPEPRHGRDPRLAFTLCRAALGDPPLAPRAFRGDSLESQLDLALRAAFALPRIVSWDARTAILLGSPIFGEHHMDYDRYPAGAVALIERFGPTPVRNGIRKFKLTSFASLITFDWRLNQLSHPKARPPGQPESD